MNPYIIIAVVLLWGGSMYFSYQKGEAACIAKAEKAALTYREKEIALLDEIEKAKQKREVIYRDKIHTVQGANDPSGCLDIPFPPDFVRGLRSAGGDAAKPKPDR